VLCYLDLDQFKLVNDTCGHVAGDEFLRQLSELLSDRLGDRGTLARLGGDEFGLLLHPCTVPTARALADELRDVVQRFRFAWAQRIFTIGVSIGIVEITSDESECPESVLSAADTACYMAKDNGRNRIQVYQADDQALLDRQAEMHWVSEINRALEQDRLCLYVQDIVTTADDIARHYEILVRMLDDQGRVWLPGAFLPAAERYSLAPAIDRWVIRNAFEWMANNPVDPHEIYAINLSGRSLTGDGFLSFVLGELDTHGIRPSNVCFEITETAAISNLAFARSFMDTLRRRGCRFALDDFGSGLSSFTYLKDLPVEFLKIDGSFVRDIHLDRVHYSIVRSMNDVGHAMGMSTIAEFVDSTAVLECLREIGVDALQGYRYSRPHPLGKPDTAVATTALGNQD
jgi:Amt family ammonium transporter